MNGTRLRRNPHRNRPRGLALILALTGLLLAGLAPALITPNRAWAQGGEAAEQEDVGREAPPGPGDLILEVFNLLAGTSAKHPDPAALAEAAIQGMLSSLRDYYADYYTPAAMRAFLSNVQGSFGGVGIQIAEDPEGYLVVDALLPGYPAEAAGMRLGDKIVAVDGESIKGQGLAAAERIRGEPGTTVFLTVTRTGQEAGILFELVRQLITADSVESKMLTGTLGYIRMTSFDDDTDAELDKTLTELLGAGAKGFVIDLRGNPGGMLDTCVRVIQRFVPEKYPILRVSWAWGSEIVKSREDGFQALEGLTYAPDGRFPYPVAVLVDGNSASASEILAVSLQEWGIARVFGETTYGKGTVQSLFPVSTGGGVKLTTATWTSGLGRDIDGAGVVPDEVLTDRSLSSTDPPFVPVTSKWVFRRGARGSDVVILQVRLNSLGYPAGPEDGVYGLVTEKALKRFQAAVGLPRSGATDAATVAALNQAGLADHPAGRVAGGGQSGQQPEPPGPPAPTVTGDKVLDRAIQWLGEGIERDTRGG